MLKKLCQFLIFFVLFPILSQAAIYKWVDEEGKVHYSQQKPVNTKTEKIKVNSRPPTPSSSYKKPTLKNKEDQKAENNKTQQGGKAAKKPQVSAQEKAKLCKQAQTNLQALLSRGRVRQRDTEGNVSYMTEEEKQQRIRREQDRVKKNCN